MSQTRHRVETFQCPRLKGVAYITIEELYMKADEMPEPELMRQSFRNCEQKMYCGIMERTGNSYRPRWNMCPAHPKFDPSTLP